jgi:outer membrane protein OmpA-like peptidoglycan-associated protein
MNDNLLALVQQALGGDFSRLASQFLGESQGSTQSALGLLLPVVLGGIAQKGATPQGATSLMSLINSSNVDTGALGNIDGLFGGGGGGVNALMKAGAGGLVSSLFGDKSGALANALASSSGIKSGAATNLLAVIVPLILAFLKKLIGARGLNAGSLSTLLAGQGDHLKNSLDPRLTGALGYSGPGAFLGGLGSQASSVARSAAAGGAAAATAVERKAGGMRWLPWVIAAAALLFLWNLLSHKPTQTGVMPPATTVAPPASSPAVTTIPPAAPQPAAVVSTSLPAKVYFETGAATIGADGGSTIAEVARIINRDGLLVAVTGYTDRTGDLSMNEELAKNRVLAVVDALKAAGVPETSIKMQPPMFVEAGAGGGSDAEARRVDISRQ